MEKENLLERYAADPAGDIPESELRVLVRENPAGAGTPTVTIPITIALVTLYICPTNACTVECPKQ